MNGSFLFHRVRLKDTAINAYLSYSVSRWIVTGGLNWSLCPNDGEMGQRVGSYSKKEREKKVIFLLLPFSEKDSKLQRESSDF